MPETTPLRVIQRAILPWNEEIQGVKFAAHDAMRMAEQVIEALAAEGYTIQPTINPTPGE